MTALEEGVAQPSSDVDEGQSSTLPCEEKTDPMLTFLGDHGLLDIQRQLIASKLTVGHLAKVERADLEDLCTDLQLSSSQKIRLKHAIKVLRSKRSRKRPKRSLKLVKSNKPNRSNSRTSKTSKPSKANIAIADDAKYAEEEIDGDSADTAHRIRSKIVIVGEAAVGKTTLQKALKGWDFEEGSKATFSVNSLRYKSRVRYKETEVRVHYEVFDTPGLDRFRDIIALYLRGALCIVVVFDVCTAASFAKAQQWIAYLESHASAYDSVILVANKIDIGALCKGNANTDDGSTRSSSGAESDEDGSDDEDDEEDEEDIVTSARMFATERGIAFLEVSAKEGDNVSVLRSWMDKQSKAKVSRCPSMLAKEAQTIQLHEPLLAGKRMSKLMDKLDHFDFNYSKCC